MKSLLLILQAVPLAVFLLFFQTKVGSQIDEQLAFVQTFFGKRLTEAVRQRGEDHIRPLYDGVLVSEELADALV